MTQELNFNLAEMIRCPVTKSDLTKAMPELLATVNEAIAQGLVVNQVGQLVEVKVESGYVNEDASLLLPIRGGIVILISDDAIPLDQLTLQN